MGDRGSPFAVDLPGIERRDAEIVRRYEAGEKLAGIGTALDLAWERVRQIRSSLSRMPLEFRCAVKGCNTALQSPNRYCYSRQRDLTGTVIRLAPDRCSRISMER
jgi:hypothetical protein